MTLTQFIREHRAELDEAITRALRYTPKEAGCRCPLRGTNHECGEVPRLNDEERRQWVLNDEGLYRWARSEGVRV